MYNNYEEHCRLSAEFLDAMHTAVAPLLFLTSRVPADKEHTLPPLPGLPPLLASH